ncbi:hypothetical protein [Microbacterium sp. Leaf320]|uniref:hypothetical protein n=1 Tax=Microbacterium sp. Leaf320 TaxID=1736334 RepID=UPI0006F756EB|nr:hypothetical protein [Microbacterium sp. Leaf320]KQQ65322.1 hypothetical protein ASF63_15370 [Microbacterium sp. Leaf320]
MNDAPRDWLIDPTTFGRPGVSDWVSTVTSRGEAECAAARLQHNAAFQVRAFLFSEERSHGSLAEALGWRRERLSRVLGGQVWVTLADLEQVLRECQSSVAGVSWSNTAAQDREAPARQIVALYLREQLQTLEPAAHAQRGMPAR